MTDNTQLYYPAQDLTPEQSARMVQHFEKLNDETKWPSGWYILPAAVINTIAMAVVIYLIIS